VVRGDILCWAEGTGQRPMCRAGGAGAGGKASGATVYSGAKLGERPTYADSGRGENGVGVVCVCVCVCVRV
jgi:hypothetical protein